MVQAWLVQDGGMQVVDVDFLIDGPINALDVIELTAVVDGKTQIGLAVFLVGSVAMVTMCREDRANVAIELQFA